MLKRNEKKGFMASTKAELLIFISALSLFQIVKIILTFALSEKYIVCPVVNRTIDTFVGPSEIATLE